MAKQKTEIVQNKYFKNDASVKIKTFDQSNQ